MTINEYNELNDYYDNVWYKISDIKSKIKGRKRVRYIMTLKYIAHKEYILMHTRVNE